MDPRKNKEIICFCNNISRDVIEDAIKSGANTLNKIFDATTAGVGACGGSCRKKLAPLLEYYLQNGKFPEKASRQQHIQPKKKKVEGGML